MLPLRDVEAVDVHITGLVQGGRDKPGPPVGEGVEVVRHVGIEGQPATRCVHVGPNAIGSGAEPATPGAFVDFGMNAEMGSRPSRSTRVISTVDSRSGVACMGGIR